jgi:hypothetical protein
VSADVNWWLLIVGVAAGVVLTWLVMADTTRRDREIGDEETAAEAGWIAGAVDDPVVDAEVAEKVLRAHRRYLGFPPPDVLVRPGELRGIGPEHVATGDSEDPGPEGGDRA